MKLMTSKIVLAMAIGSFSLTSFAFSKNDNSGFVKGNQIPVLTLQTPDLKLIEQEDKENDAKHLKYRIATANTVNINPQNSGVWTTLANGDKVWQLEINYPGAKGLNILFDRFIVYGNSTLDAYSKTGKKLHTTFNVDEVLDHGYQNMDLCYGDDIILQLVEPKGNLSSEININAIHYVYRGMERYGMEKFNDSDPCQVNVNCTPESNNYQKEKFGIVRILTVDQGGSYWCTGSVVNNTALDCKPYVLTALHCGVSSSATHFNQYKFYFRYEASGCTNPSTEGTLASNSVSGSVKLASSNDGGGTSGSDFLLLQMGTLANEATTITKIKGPNFKAYWCGWNANNTASSSGVSIHHPSGDIKKISTYTQSLTTTSWGISGTHWRVIWAGTTNGHGVTEPGSSGSPIFSYNNGNPQIVGTLTGGGSFCNATTSPDSYGKMSYHWTSNGTPANEQLKTYLDPMNSGSMVYNGSWDPCTGFLGIESNEILETISVYPNPATTSLSVDLSNLVSNSTIRIYDLSGKLLMQQKGNSGVVNEMNISSLTNGIYQVVIETEAGRVTKKISKL